MKSLKGWAIYTIVIMSLVILLNLPRLGTIETVPALIAIVIYGLVLYFAVLVIKKGGES